MDPIFLAFLDVPGMESSSSGEVQLARLLAHPLSVAIPLSILIAGFLPPCKMLRDRLAARLRPRLSRCRTPLLWQSLLWVPAIFLLVLSTAAESVFLDGTTARFVILAIIETTVCVGYQILLTAVIQALKRDSGDSDSE